MSNDNKSGQRGQPAAGGNQDPKPSNTGVSDKKFGYSIDWIRGSIPSGVAPLDLLPSHEVFTPSGEDLRPLPNYDTVLSLVAARVDWHSEKPSQKQQVNMNGQECQLAVGHGVNLAEVLSHIIYSVFGKITRLDFAVDVFLPGMDPVHIKRAWENGRVSSPAKRCGMVGQVGAYDAETGKARSLGDTVYIGSRSSERVLRVYDKAAREGVQGPWVRIELECKGDHAQALAKSMLISGIIAAGKAYLREFIEVRGVEWFSRAIAGNDGTWLEPVEKKMTDRQRWYRDQIFPAMREDLKTDNGWLRGLILGLIDLGEEDEAHGGVKGSPPQLNSSRKWLKAYRALERDFGLQGGIFRLAFRYAGEDETVRLISELGYRWNTVKQRWER